MTTTEIHRPHYRRTKSGEWVIAGPSSIIRPNTGIDVRKRDGSVKREWIEAVGKEYDDHGVKCRYGYIAERREYSGRRVPIAERCVACGGHGSVEQELGECEACGADFDC